MLYLIADSEHNVLEYPLSDVQIRRRYGVAPETKEMPNLEAWGVYVVDFEQNPRPTKGYRTILNTPVWDTENNKFVRTFQQVPRTPEEIEKQWGKVRSARGKYLTMSDWSQLPDATLSDDKRQKYAVYRQALRDITKQEDPFQIDWPEKP